MIVQQLFLAFSIVDLASENPSFSAGPVVLQAAQFMTLWPAAAGNQC